MTECLKYPPLVKPASIIPTRISPSLIPVLLAGKISELAIRIRLLLSTARTGRFLREGIRVALSEKTERGKIITHECLAAGIQVNRDFQCRAPRGILLKGRYSKTECPWTSDTAGLRDPPRDEAEEEGLKRALEAIREADIRVWVIDGSEPPV